MLNDTNTEIQAAATRLASRLSALFAAEMERLLQTSETASQVTSTSPAMASSTAAHIEGQGNSPSASPPRIPLSQRKNVFRVPSGRTLPPRPSDLPPAEASSPAPAASDLADAARKVETPVMDPLVGREQHPIATARPAARIPEVEVIVRKRPITGDQNPSTTSSGLGTEAGTVTRGPHLSLP